MDDARQDQEARGRSAGSDELARNLSSAPRDYLAGALQNPEITPQHVAILLRNRAADEPILTAIAGEQKWTQSYAVKSGLVRHPKTPHPLALNLVRFLYWKDLAKVAEDPFLFPPLKRLAERILSEKLGEMALGEKITLARTGGRGLVARFMEEAHPKVLEALLWNGRVTSSDVMAAASRSTSRPEVLEALGRHPRWSTRKDIRLALLRNPRTPVPVTLGFLSSMSESDIRGLADLPETPRALKMACARLLRGRR